MAKFTIARQATAWEETTIEADSFEDAIDKLQRAEFGVIGKDEWDGSWALDHDSWEPNGSYWGRNEDTEEDFTK
jgi:hypothetical protein